MNQSNSKEGSSSCQCTMILNGENEETKKIVLRILSKLQSMRRFLQGRWLFLGLGSEKKRCGTHPHKPDGEWDKTAEGMMLNFSECGHLYFGSPAPQKEEN